jgi:KUP system potassium uptake protein
MLGYLPRVKVIHTSSREIGQIYIPSINWAVLAMTLLLVFMFRSSGSLAAAYGIAVSATMVITSFLIFVLAQRRWGVPMILAFPAFLLLLFVDMSFFLSNLLKFANGGWFPIVVGLVMFTIMTTWRRGRELLYQRLRENLQPLEEFVADLEKTAPQRVEGTAIYMTGDLRWTPPALIHNLTHNKVVHRSLLFLTVNVTDEPYVRPNTRVKIKRLNDSAYTLTALYGFMEAPNIHEILNEGRDQIPFELDPHRASFFLGRETVVATNRPGMALWRERLFAVMSRNAQRATDYFGIPRKRVVEMGLQIEM